MILVMTPRTHTLQCVLAGVAGGGWVVFSELPMLQTQLCFAENKNWLANY